MITFTQQQMEQHAHTPEPRDITRLAFDAAIRMAATEPARDAYLRGLQWLETRWQITDQMVAADAQKRQQIEHAQAQAEQPPDGGAPPAPSPVEPRKFSAVELHGHDSPEAKAMREGLCARQGGGAAPSRQGVERERPYPGIE